MSEHDPLCPCMRYQHTDCDCCQCDLIAKVRKDMLDKCIVAVSKEQNLYPLGTLSWGRLGEAVVALRSLGEQQ